MAVQQNKKTPSKRGMHRSHDGLAKPALSVDPQSGETHSRHRITPDGAWMRTKRVDAAFRAELDRARRDVECRSKCGEIFLDRETTIADRLLASGPF